MVSTRSRTSGDIKAQVAAIDEACASTGTKQTTITSFFLSSVKRTNDVVTETTTMTGVVVTEASTSPTSNASSSEPTAPESSTEEKLAEQQPSEALTNGRAKKRKAADAGMSISLSVEARVADIWKPLLL